MAPWSLYSHLLSSLVCGQAVYTWKVEAAPFPELYFAHPMALHNRGTESFQKLCLTPGASSSGSLQPAIHAFHRAELSILPQGRCPLLPVNHSSVVSSRFTLSNKVLILATSGRSYLQEELFLWAPSNILTCSAGSHETLAFVSRTCLPAHGFYLFANIPLPPTPMPQPTPPEGWSHQAEAR